MKYYLYIHIRNFRTGIKTRSIFLWLFFSLLPVLLAAQGTLGARSLAIGQAGVALENDNWSLFQNPALLRTEKPAVSFYGMRFAGFAEITDLAATITAGNRLGTFGGGVHRYGFDLFNESNFRLGYKNNLQLFHFGISINYSHVAQGGGYGSAGAVGINAGIAAEIGRDLLLGAHAVNLNRPAYGNTDEELTRELTIGLSYRMTESALILFDLSKDARFPLSVRAGVELQLIPRFYARSGISTKPVTWSLGFGYGTDRFSVNIAAQRHEVLGISPGVDFGIDF